MRRIVVSVVCGVMVLGATAAMVDLIPGSNLVANAGFESPLAAAPACSTPVISGNWRAVSCAATQLAERVSAPVQTGGFSAHVRTLARNGGQAYLYQDLPGFGLNDSFELSAWVMPVGGSQQMSMLFGWDRTSGAVAGTASIVVNQDGVSYSAWGRGGTAPPIAYGVWHHLRLAGDVTTGMQQLFIDRVPLDPVLMGTPKVALSVTLLLGQGTGVNTPASEFYFDDARVVRLVLPPVDVIACFADLEAAHEAIAERDEQNRALQEALTAADTSNAQLAGQIDELTSQTSALQAALDIANARNAALEPQIAELSSQNSALQAALDAANARNAHADALLANLAQTLLDECPETRSRVADDVRLRRRRGVTRPAQCRF